MIIFTDLDGTLLNSNQEISNEDYETLQHLGNKSIIRVVATGRHIVSAKKVLQYGFPIDYIIFSTGAGILNWKTNEVIYKTWLEKSKVQAIADILLKNNVCFSVHNQIPDDHCYFYKTPSFVPDFEERNKNYRDYISELHSHEQLNDSSRFIVILSPDYNEFVKLETELYSKIQNIKIIRASSPINGTNIWLEIYPEYVSKGLTAKWLCDYLNIDYSKTAGIGNDYNDIELLDFTAKSFLVENAPNELKSKYLIAKSNNNSGFSDAVKSYL